jgi:hypothetical protein
MTSMRHIRPDESEVLVPDSVSADNMISGEPGEAAPLNLTQ